jgi:hypothetical protein
MVIQFLFVFFYEQIAPKKNLHTKSNTEWACTHISSCTFVRIHVLVGCKLSDAIRSKCKQQIALLALLLILQWSLAFQTKPVPRAGYLYSTKFVKQS